MIQDFLLEEVVHIGVLPLKIPAPDKETSIQPRCDATINLIQRFFVTANDDAPLCLSMPTMPHRPYTVCQAKAGASKRREHMVSWLSNKCLSLAKTTFSVCNARLFVELSCDVSTSERQSLCVSLRDNHSPTHSRCSSSLPPSLPPARHRLNLPNMPSFAELSMALPWYVLC